MLIKEWYKKEYPTDDMVHEINDNVTFDMIVGTLLNNPDKIYDAIGAQDSSIRERIFLEIASKLCTPYENIYNLWLKK